MRADKPKAMLVAGVMSGTSADGVDVAVVRVSPGRAGVPGIELIGHRGFRYPAAVRAAVLRAAAGEMKVAELSRLDWKLGEVYAGCVLKACAAMGVSSFAGSSDSQPPDAAPLALGLIGMHGQTIYHEAPRATWQIGRAAVVRERVGVPVVSDFRAADLAAAGQGAPLVPMLDFCLFRSANVNRVLLNLGGIANMTVIPARPAIAEVTAFDAGPGNMVIDAIMQSEFGEKFDRGGRTAARGRAIPAIVERLSGEKYFVKPAPKSCGREQFGVEYASRVLTLVKNAGGSAEDAVATATGLTVATVVEAYQRVSAGVGSRNTELIAAGGGVRNRTLMRGLRDGFEQLGATVRTTDDLGVPAQAKEAVAFALLGWLSWHGLAGNVPSATGARGGRVLGTISW